MRRRILAIICLLLLCGSCAAEEAVNRALNAADLGRLEEFAGDAAPEMDLKQVVKDASQGKLTSADELLAQLRDRALTALREALRACGTLIAPALLLATLRCALPEGRGGSEGARFLLLCVLMIFGRSGTVTVLTAMTRRDRRVASRYPAEEISIG